MSEPLIIDQTMLDAASDAARESPRGRRNRNFHAANESPCHRLLNAIEPGSYVAPHRHLDPAKDESIVILRGRLGCVFFDDTGRIERKCMLSPNDTVGVDIPHGTWHSIVALEPGTVFFEAKAGPYLPLSADETAAWAPREGEDGAAVFCAVLHSEFDWALPGKAGSAGVSGR